MLTDTSNVLTKLDWMEQERIWPNGLRYLWTDAFGVILLLSLYEDTGDERFVEKARWVVDEVDRVLGRTVGYRIGEEPDRDGQYYHYLAMWIYAMHCFGAIDPQYREKAIAIARGIHPRCVIPGTGVIWKMEEDLSGPYPGYGLGLLDAFQGYVVYSVLAPDELAPEIDQMKELIEHSYRNLVIDQDLGLGMMLWITHFHTDEVWALHQKLACLEMLEHLWIDPPGYYCRQTGATTTKFAFTNYGVSVGLQAVNALPENVRKINETFEHYRSGDEYGTNAITHVMACNSHFPGKLIV